MQKHARVILVANKVNKYLWSHFWWALKLYNARGHSEHVNITFNVFLLNVYEVVSFLSRFLRLFLLQH